MALSDDRLREVAAHKPRSRAGLTLPQMFVELMFGEMKQMAEELLERRAKDEPE